MGVVDVINRVDKVLINVKHGRTSKVDLMDIINKNKCYILIIFMFLVVFALL